MNLPDFVKMSNENAHALKWKMDRLLRLEKLTFPNCGPLAGCTPNYAGLSFFKKDNCYCMGFDQTVHYSGDAPPMMHLVFNNAVFRDFSMMLDFIRELPCDEPPPRTRADTPSKPEAAPREDYDLDSIANMNAVKTPKRAAQVTLDFETIKRKMKKFIIGQDEAVEKISHQTSLQLKKKAPKKPSSFVLFGPSGTGKTEAAKVLANILEPLEYSMVFTELNTFTEAHSVYRLLGAPPGYIGYDDTPVFEAVRHNPKTVFIFDEIEKSHPEVIKTFMSVLDEGRISSRKELENHSREYDFKQCLFLFTSNLNLGSVPKKRIGFTLSEDVEDIRQTEDSVEVSYRESIPDNEQVELTRRIYRDTEIARKAFVKSGVLREIASRFNSFVEFKPLSDEAKKQILVKQVIETGFEYDIRLTYISSSVLQGLIDASMSENSLTVRSFKAIIEGYLAAAFAEAGTYHNGQGVRLEGTIKSPKLVPGQKK